jgi:hypothetical protein
LLKSNAIGTLIAATYTTNNGRHPWQTVKLSEWSIQRPSIAGTVANDIEDLGGESKVGSKNE